MHGNRFYIGEIDNIKALSLSFYAGPLCISHETAAYGICLRGLRRTATRLARQDRLVLEYEVLSYRADQAFGVGVLPGIPWRGE
jgi:hypothetical protein